jgi:hypothetical protein
MVETETVVMLLIYASMVIVLGLLVANMALDYLAHDIAGMQLSAVILLAIGIIIMAWVKYSQENGGGKQWNTMRKALKSGTAPLHTKVFK